VINNKKVLAIIPARGGSKGLKGKNVKVLCGKPLIAWTIQAALGSKYIDKIIVSSDDKKIIEIAKIYGAEVPFIRPKKLSSDKAKHIDVIRHAIDYFRDIYKIIIVLQPTSPLRTVKNINDAFKEFRIKKAKSVVSVCKLEHPIQWTGKLPEDLNMRDFINPINNVNREELEFYYILNGAIYISEIDYLEENAGYFGDDTFAFIMEREESIDIDNMIDFKLAEILMKNRLDGKC